MSEKSDKLDAKMLAKPARIDAELLSPIEHGTEDNQRHRLSITLRDSIVRQRVAIISTVRFSLKSMGIRPPNVASDAFAKKCRHEMEETTILNSIKPALEMLDAMNQQIKELDKQIAQVAEEFHPETKLMAQIPGVGPITSLSFALAIGDPDRFDDPRDVAAYLGLVPRRDQSGGSDKQLPISKAGNREVRRLLVQRAQHILGHYGPDCDLRRQGLKLAERGGKAAKKKAVVAIARKLAVLMLVLRKKGGSHEPLHNSATKSTAINNKSQTNKKPNKGKNAKAA